MCSYTYGYVWLIDSLCLTFCAPLINPLGLELSHHELGAHASNTTQHPALCPAYMRRVGREGVSKELGTEEVVNEGSSYMGVSCISLDPTQSQAQCAGTLLEWMRHLPFNYHYHPEDIYGTDNLMQ